MFKLNASEISTAAQPFVFNFPIPTEQKSYAQCNAQLGLAPLTGSQKQIAWGEQIRFHAFRDCAMKRFNLVGCAPELKEFADARDAVENDLSKEHAAAWWIDRREFFGDDFYRKLFNEAIVWSAEEAA